MATDPQIAAIQATIAQANAAAAYGAGVGTVANVQATSQVAAQAVATYAASPEAQAASAYSGFINGGLGANTGLRDATFAAYSAIKSVVPGGSLLPNPSTPTDQLPGASNPVPLGPPPPMIAGIAITPVTLLLGGAAAVALILILVAVSK